MAASNCDLFGLSEYASAPTETEHLDALWLGIAYTARLAADPLPRNVFHRVP